MIDQLHRAQKLIQSAIDESLQVYPDQEAIKELIAACKWVDDQYKELCSEYDEDDDLEPGTTYKEGGTSIMFYTGSDTWHDVSVVLRKLGLASLE